MRRTAANLGVAVTVPVRPRVVTPVALTALAELIGAAEPTEAADLTGVTLRSGSVVAGDLYAALPGASTHGARFALEAKAAGARAILTDPDGALLVEDLALPTLVVEQPRRWLGTVASAVYGSPATSFTLVGVTGTQGKTTTTQLLAGALAAAGRRTSVIGTMGTWVDGERMSSALTTPEAPDLHALFAVMREADVEVCAMEVSSHALVLGRVDGVCFDVAVFLNFGRDHLDFHHDVEHYFAAKADLFTRQRARRALLNIDDPAVASLRETLEIPVRTFSPSGRDADWWCSEVTLRADGSDFGLTSPDGQRHAVSVQVAGDFNVANAVAALAAAGEAGFDVEAATAGLAQVQTVDGRLERIEAGQPFSVVVDYAHKPDAVTAALSALRPVTAGRLIIVLGAGGDRDPGKRELMGAAAARLADVLVVTDDNPRSEDPAAIRAALLAGAGIDALEVYEIADRRSAIGKAVAMARPGDTVLVAGKGHETGQEAAGHILPFDDRMVVREILGSLAGTASTS